MTRSYKTIEEFKAAPKHPVVLVLDNIRSLNNVGSFFRTADSFLLEKIYLCGITGRPPHREIEKTALGATLSVDWEYFSDTGDVIHHLREMNYRILAVEQHSKSIPLQEIKVNNQDKIALIFGNEVTGISESILSLCDQVVEVPQMGTKHSLNVSVCGGIVCWEVLKKMKVLEDK